MPSADQELADAITAVVRRLRVAITALTRRHNELRGVQHALQRFPEVDEERARIELAADGLELAIGELARIRASLATAAFGDPADTQVRSTGIFKAIT